MFPLRDKLSHPKLMLPEVPAAATIPPVSHASCPLTPTPKGTAVTLCALLARDLFAIAKFTCFRFVGSLRAERLFARCSGTN